MEHENTKTGQNVLLPIIATILLTAAVTGVIMYFFQNYTVSKKPSEVMISPTMPIEESRVTATPEPSPTVVIPIPTITRSFFLPIPPSSTNSGLLGR